MMRNPWVLTAAILVAVGAAIVVGLYVLGLVAGKKVDPHVAKIESLRREGKNADAFEFALKAPDTANAAIVDWLEANAEAVEPGFLYVLARRKLADDPDAALFWYFAGNLRAFYDGRRCADPTATQGAMMLSMVVPRVLDYAESHPKSIGTAAQKALDWEARQPGDRLPDWICAHGIRAFEGKPPAHKPKAEWPAIRHENRESFERYVETLVAVGAK